jgi:catechol 2,3-dioxygenase-like lactoylglutathione lyase family enzyme
MKLEINSLRPFVGAKNFDVSRAFYRDLGFEEAIISNGLSLFRSGVFGFYLQNYYLKEWLENTMLFLEVRDVHKQFQQVQESGLDKKYPHARIQPVKKEEWGEVFYIIDPAGILLHVAQFN